MGFPLRLVWRDEAGCPVLLWAEYDPDIRMFWLYWSHPDVGFLEWLGDADDVGNPEQWAPDLAEDVRLACIPPDPTLAPDLSMGPGRIH